MVEKAKLDILENLPEIEITDAIMQAEAPIDSSVTVLGERWAFNKLFLIAAPVLIVVALVITGLLWFYLSRTEDKAVTKLKSGTPAVIVQINKPRITEKIGLQTANEPAKTNKVFFKDFIIDLHDKTGQSKILLCDVALDVSEDADITELEKRVDIRNLIYQIAAKKSIIVLRSIEERRRLKKELLLEVSKLLGDGIVKELYFTNYVIM